DGSSTERDIWPIALGYFDNQRIIVAWCEMRDGFRHFRTDRLTALENLAVRYPKRRLQLVREWRQLQGISPPPF
ncbi:MAG: WYL domain-containing protein, partial [Rhizobiaceae bacterium]|nr:WYL domain-containing protein [Rhizobiaceae bacterium]